MKFKNFVKDFVPPIILRLGIDYLLNNFKEYQSYSEAMNACTSEAYQSIELCDMVADKTLIHIEKLKEKPFNLNPNSVFLSSAINQYINTFSKKSLNILDFGGACGAHYFEIRRFIPKHISLKWYVVETDQMVKSAINKGLNNDELKFVSSIEEINTEIDFLHSSIALPYVPNPYDFTNKLIKIRANWIFFNRMIFNENDRDIITIQKSFLSANGPGNLPKDYKDKIISYPLTIMSFEKFNSIIINNDYELEWTFETPSRLFQIKNQKIIGRGLLYVKK